MNSLVALPVALPLLSASVLAAIPRSLPRWVANLIAFITTSAIIVLCLLLLLASAHAPLVQWMGGWAPRGKIGLGIAFVVDPTAGLLSTLSAILASAAIVFSWRFYESAGSLFQALMMIYLAALIGFVYSADAFTQFVFFELMGVATYALTGYKLERPSLAGALSYAVINSIAAFAVLIGIGFVYGRAGALNLAQLGASLSKGPHDPLVSFALVLIMGGYFVKAAQAPFHFWIADAHAVAPTPVCVLFSGIMVPLGLYGAFRIYWTVFSASVDPESCRLMFLVLGSLTAVVGSGMCVMQSHLKRMLAFSTMAHMGVATIGFGCLSPVAASGAIQYLVGHGFVKGCLFLCSGMLLHRFGEVDEIKLRGRGKDPALRVVKWIFFAAALGLAGTPIFGLFLGKARLETAVPQLAWLFMVVGGFTAGAVIRSGLRIFSGFGWPHGPEQGAPTEEKESPDEPHGPVPFSMVAASAVLIVCAILLGITRATSALASLAAARLMDFSGYWMVQFAGHSRAILTPSAESPIWSSYLYAAGALAIAGGVASFGFRKPKEQPLPVKLLRSIHSGHVGDYVAWLALGFACMATYAICLVK